MRNGTAFSLSARQRPTVLTGDYGGKRGRGGAHTAQRATAGSRYRRLGGFSRRLAPIGVAAPQGGARGYRPVGWDGRRGTHGAARVLLV